MHHTSFSANCNEQAQHGFPADSVPSPLKKALAKEHMNEAPEIFGWKAFSDWQNFVGDTFAKKALKALEVKVRERKAEFRYVDDPSVFIKIHEALGDFAELIEKVLHRFYERYAFLKMYHCCRPISVESYYLSGIQALNMSEMNTRFQGIFLGNPKYPLVTPDLVQGAIEYMAKSYKRQGYVYFGLDDRFLINHCGHYLIEGSEYLQSLAAFIERKVGGDLKREFREYGKPTVFELRIPISFVPEGELRELASELLQTWAYNTAHSRNDPYELDFGIELDRKVPSDHIMGHYHPERIPDPSNGFEDYCYLDNLKGR